MNNGICRNEKTGTKLEKAFAGTMLRKKNAAAEQQYESAHAIIMLFVATHPRANARKVINALKKNERPAMSRRPRC